MTAKAQTRTRANSTNGQPTDQTLAEAIAYEEAIAREAITLRGDAEKLTPILLMQLRDLLRRPIPSALIQTVGQVTGKPYESTGIKSVQVQIDRMDAVLTPCWWQDIATYTDDGKLCHVRVEVGNPGETTMFARESWGGVDRGSTQGNVRKGSYTNAAKLAFARVGPGWEIYIGAADFDPDTDEAAATAQNAPGDQPPAVQTIAADRVAHLMEAFVALPHEGEGEGEALKRDLKLKLGSIGVSATGIGAAFAKLTPGQADEIDTWISERNGGAS